ncbi:hypothetical protein MRB53_019143 [Persea americana]|uniref:Uncharacterized protein n=1 Tax=Persea americana TaxID=3435 RepID=A0ACC2MAT9_PERAE|nr:hypothetical protein MRB53_019143 [Persea americana]
MNFRSLEEFWPFYVTQHSKPSTRRWHFMGTLTSCLLLLMSLLFNWWFVIFVPIFGYGFAWYSHFFVEGNVPATWIRRSSALERGPSCRPFDGDGLGSLFRVFFYSGNGIESFSVYKPIQSAIVCACYLHKTRLEKAFEGNRPEAIWSLRFRDLTDVETEQFIQMQQLLSNTYEFLRRC